MHLTLDHGLLLKCRAPVYTGHFCETPHLSAVDRWRHCNISNSCLMQLVILHSCLSMDFLASKSCCTCCLMLIADILCRVLCCKVDTVQQPNSCHCHRAQLRISAARWRAAPWWWHEIAEMGTRAHSACVYVLQAQESACQSWHALGRCPSLSLFVCLCPLSAFYMQCVETLFPDCNCADILPFVANGCACCHELTLPP